MIIFDCGLFARCRVNKYLVLKFLRKEGRKEGDVNFHCIFIFNVFIYYQRLPIDKIQYAMYVINIQNQIIRIISETNFQVPRYK